MVIRRIHDHVATHNWFAVAVDLAIVVAGVFLGTQANNWNQARLDRQRGTEYRLRLIDDLSANETDFRQRIYYYNHVSEHGLAALADLRRPRSTDGEQFLFNAYEATQILPRSTQRTTYQEIQSAGATATVGDEALRQQIANYYFNLDTTNATIATLPLYRDQMRRVMPYEIQHTIRTHCSESYAETAQGRAINGLATACHLGLDPAAVAIAIAQIRATPGIALDLTRSLVDDDQKILQFLTMLRRAGKIRAVLETTVARHARP